MNEKEQRKFEKQQLEALRETLRTAPAFTCMCCQNTKPKGEAAGAHIYRPDDVNLRKAMIDESGKMRVGTYVLCLECVDSLPENVIYQRVTKNFGQAGLFGKTVQG